MSKAPLSVNWSWRGLFAHIFSSFSVEFLHFHSFLQLLPRNFKKGLSWTGKEFSFHFGSNFGEFSKPQRKFWILLRPYCIFYLLTHLIAQIAIFFGQAPLFDSFFHHIVSFPRFLTVLITFENKRIVSHKWVTQRRAFWLWTLKNGQFWTFSGTEDLKVIKLGHVWLCIDNVVLGVISVRFRVNSLQINRNLISLSKKVILVFFFDQHWLNILAGSLKFTRHILCCPKVSILLCQSM